MGPRFPLKNAVKGDTFRAVALRLSTAPVRLLSSLITNFPESRESEYSLSSSDILGYPLPDAMRSYFFVAT